MATKKSTTTARPKAKPLSVRGAIIKVVTDAGEPIKASDVITSVLKLVKLGGKTPNTTVAKIMSLECAKDDGEIVRLDRALYDLRSRAITSGEFAESTENVRKDDEPASPIEGAVVLKDGGVDVKPDPKPTSARKSRAKPKVAAAA